MSHKNLTNVLFGWTLEDGYDERSGIDTNLLYPYRLFSSGSKPGLIMTLGIKQENMDYLCRGPVQGFKVVLHSPNELPQLSGRYFRIPVGEDVRVAIKPNMLKTSKSLKDYSPHR